MKRILTALVLIPLALALVFWGPNWLFTLAVAGVAMLAAWEFLMLAESSGATPPRFAVLGAILGIFLAILFADSFEWLHQTEAVLGVLSLFLLVYCTFFKPVEEMLAAVATAIFCLFYTGFTMIAIPALRAQSNGPSLVTFLFCVVWAGDIVALYVGRTIGRHKLAPKLSPNKTWEGAVGSVVGSLLATGGLLALAHFFVARWDKVWLSYPEDLWYWLGLAVLINVAAQVGDLAESALKRSVGVKDSGTLLPGHGGVLDRIDALLLAAPVLWYVQLVHLRF
jgi:phosphatidate cytidylyltransferase